VVPDGEVGFRFFDGIPYRPAQKDATNWWKVDSASAVEFDMQFKKSSGKLESF